MKDGFTMSELEQFGKQHKLTILFSAIFLLAAIFNTLFWHFLSIWLLALGAIVGLCFPEQIGNFLLKTARAFSNQDKTVRMIFAGVALALAVIFPPLEFCIAGLIAGVALKYKAEVFKGKEEEPKKPEEPKE